jgi:hypothetical protein
MGRRRKPKTAREKILSVIAWGRRAGVHNIAAELRDALALLPAGDDRSGR